MKLAIGSDHAGYALKEVIKEYLAQRNEQIKDFGTYSEDSTDYPDYAHPVATSVETGESELGILICGSANGVCMTANKHSGIRAGLSWTPEIAELARLHNNANIVCIPSRFVSEQTGIDIVTTFINASFEGGRHQKRVDKIACY
ncbi:MAG: ribose 5-phosphate isomerase B [Flavobacteriales bacterium]|jgi:ribose 5-phosphate isomerase B